MANRTVVAGVLLVLCLGYRSRAQDAWSLKPWKHRQQIVIGNPNEHRIARHQLKLQIPFQEGMRRKMQDIRLCDKAGAELPFYVEAVVPEERATVWVNLADVGPNHHIWLYFGNREADRAGDFSRTFQKLEVTEDTIGLWHCDEGQGDVVHDVSGHGHHLRAEGGAISWANGDGGCWGGNTAIRFEQGSCVVLPGDGRATKPYLRLENRETLEKLRAFTWQVWVRLDRAPEGGSVSVIRKGSGLCYLNLRRSLRPSVWLDGCGMQVGLGSDFRDGTPSLTLGRWHHLSTTLDAESLKLKIYQDAELVAHRTLERLPPANTSPLVIGGYYSPTFPGAIDELRLSSRALRPDEIAADYHRCSSSPALPLDVAFAEVEHRP